MFDATQRSLNSANEELQWQATSAEALRMRLADVLRQTRAEEQKMAELRAEHRHSEGVVQELLEHWMGKDAPNGRTFPVVCQQAQRLLERIRRGEAQHEGGGEAPNIGAVAEKGQSPAPPML